MWTDAIRPAFLAPVARAATAPEWAPAPPWSAAADNGPMLPVCAVTDPLRIPTAPTSDAPTATDPIPSELVTAPEPSPAPPSRLPVIRTAPRPPARTAPELAPAPPTRSPPIDRRAIG